MPSWIAVPQGVRLIVVIVHGLCSIWLFYLGFIKYVEVCSKNGHLVRLMGMSRDQVVEKDVSCLLLAELEWSPEAEVSSLQPVCSRGICSTQPDAATQETSRGPCQASYGLTRELLYRGLEEPQPHLATNKQMYRDPTSCPTATALICSPHLSLACSWALWVVSSLHPHQKTKSLFPHMAPLNSFL